MVRWRRCRQRRDQPFHRTQIMHRAEFVNVRQHHFDALRLGLEAAIAQQRVEPDQAAEDLCSRSISNASVASASRSRPSEINSTMAPWPSTRRPHNLLKLCSEVAIRVPPAQSSTDDEQLAKASSGSRARNARVTLVSRVPNKNTETRLRASVMAWRKCRNSLVYSLIDPEISSSATIGAGLSMRPSLRI